MLSFENAERIMVHTGTTDMRYGIHGLFALAGCPAEGEIHLFCSWDRRTVKILFAEEGCCWLITKRLTVGRYVWPEKGKDAQIDAAQMLRILEGTTLRDRIESDGKITQRMF